ncbi:MAG: NAD(+) synthase [Lachnospiraceae bacterium]|nr:NAD(+) synthase [Lachnospiraceae bacterium]
MKDGFLKVAVATPEIKVADCRFNTEQMIAAMQKAAEQGAKLLVLPELCMTGYTCGDLFLQDTLLAAALQGVKRICEASAGMDLLTVFGMPFLKSNRLYNVAVPVQNGRVLGMIPKQHLPNYSEFCEMRYFAPGSADTEEVTVCGTKVPFGTKLLFACEEIPELVLGIEICEDLWVAEPPSGRLAEAGATVIANPSASDETTGKAAYRRALVQGQSARTLTAYLYADAGEGESTTDLVFAGHNMIAENGTMLAESELFTNGMLLTEIDLGRLKSERRRMGTFEQNAGGYETVYFSMPSLAAAEALPELSLTRLVDKAPFVPADRAAQEKRWQEIIQIQAMGLKKRLLHTGCKNAVLGISGGLDSTLALLVTCKAFELAGLDVSGILAVTMPCFGTTDRTYRNACTLVEALGATLKEVVIKDAVRRHFIDIGQPEEKHDVTFENAQARERTQVLMDLANQNGGMVIGTGDLSELALGWATYNGDHMSMYGVNASVPKTLIRYLVAYFAKEAKTPKLRTVLEDILDTPVSPELLPPKDGEIAQKTEDIVGPYELHDFFLYYMLRFGYTPTKIYRLAQYAFAGDYDAATILKWLQTFYRRFFTQQFKRSCLPDGPKVGSVGVSPRGDLRMPSDACMTLWMEEIEQLEKAM